MGTVLGGSLTWFSDGRHVLPMISHLPSVRSESIVTFLFFMIAIIVMVCYIDSRKEANERVNRS